MSDTPRYCVYDDAVAARLLEISRATYEDIITAQRLFPDVDCRTVISMALHKAATIATNSAIGDPLDKAFGAPPR